MRTIPLLLMLSTSASALLMLSTSASAQNLIPSGQLTPGHALRILGQNVVGDAGGSAGSGILGNGYLTELGITNTGTPICINDALITAQGGYHQLCFGANVNGSGIISFNAYGGASAYGLLFNINGTNFPFPGSGNGNVIGPTSPYPTGGNFVVWNGTTTVKDSGLPFAAIPVNLKAYGAIGNGVADDTSAVNSWLSACLATNQPCYAPAGTYRVTSSINVNSTTAYVDIGGDGLGTKFFMDNAAPTTLFNITAGGLTVGLTYLHDFYIIQPTNNAAGSAGIVLTNRMRAVIERVRVDQNYRGIDFTTSYAPHVKDCDFRSNKAEGIKFENDNSANNALIEHNYFLSNGSAGTYAITVPSGEAPRFIANDLEGNYGGIGITGGTVVSPFFDSNYFENQTTTGDIDLQPGGPVVSSPQIVNNYFQNGPTVTWVYAADLRVIGNTLKDTTINLGTGVVRPYVCENTFQGTGSFPAQANYCPIATLGTPLSCGTSPSASGTDVNGSFTTGTGSPGACTIAFNVDHGTAATTITVTPGPGSSGTAAYVSSSTSTGFTVTLGAGVSSGKYYFSASWR